MKIIKGFLQGFFPVAIGIGLHSRLQFHVQSLLFSCMGQFLICRHRQHDCCRFTIVSEHARSAMFLQFHSVFTRPAGEVCETNDVLIKNYFNDAKLARNSVRQHMKS